MPKLNAATMEQQALPTNNYGYSATRLEDLGATEYTLVSLIIDVSSSVMGFGSEMEDAIKQIIQACQKSPRADNLMVRITTFNGLYVDELHGFKLLEKCNVGNYTGSLNISGSTNLYDACIEGINAVVHYAQTLSANDYSSNAIVIFITDGEDNKSSSSSTMVKDALRKAVQDEDLESIVSILVGVNTEYSGVSSALSNFQKTAEITQYVEIQNADAKSFAKLASFVSKSISAQSQSLGSGGPSKALTF